MVLEHAVRDRVVLRVRYKDGYSYRNPRRSVRARRAAGADQAKTSIARHRLLLAVKRQCDSATGSASLDRLVVDLFGRKATAENHAAAIEALQREVDHCTCALRLDLDCAIANVCALYMHACVCVCVCWCVRPLKGTLLRVGEDNWRSNPAYTESGPSDDSDDGEWRRRDTFRSDSVRSANATQRNSTRCRNVCRERGQH